MSLLSYILLTPYGNTFIPKGQEDEFINRGRIEGVYDDWNNTLQTCWEQIQNKPKTTNNYYKWPAPGPTEQKNSGKRKRKKRKNKN